MKAWSLLWRMGRRASTMVCSAARRPIGETRAKRCRALPPQTTAIETWSRSEAAVFLGFERKVLGLCSWQSKSAGHGEASPKRPLRFRRQPSSSTCWLQLVLSQKLTWQPSSRQRNLKLAQAGIPPMCHRPPFCLNSTSPQPLAWTRKTTRHQCQWETPTGPPSVTRL